MSSIPAAAIVNVTPNVIDAGGTGLDFVGLVLTNSTRVPVGTIARFTSALAVTNYFGTLSTEALLASIYFGGYNGSTIKPAQILFSQYPTAPVPAYLRGAPLGLTLAQLIALPTGTVTLTINGRAVTSGTISLASATSFSNAASIIQTALGDKDATVTGSIAATTLTVTAVASGALAVGQVISGAGITAGTTITAFGTGTGGTGTYTVSTSQTAASTTITAGATIVAYDSQSGAFVITGGTPGAVGTITPASVSAMATSLKLTTAAGAVTSQGSAIYAPAAAMDAVVASTQDFVSFMTAFKPSPADMLAFSAWNDGKSDRYLYVMWDNDGAPTTSSDTTSVGYQIAQAGYSGTMPFYDPNEGASKAALAMGTIASINFGLTNGRITLAFRSGSLLPGVTNETIADNLIANGYNFYGSYATANANFTWFYPGQVSGPFSWVDSYIDQVWLSNGLQLALMNLLANVNRIPYNPDGYAMVEAAMTGMVRDGLNFGAITAGVTLSDTQVIEVNALAGREVAPTISTRGWYILVSDPGAQVRAARGSPLVILFYCDGQAIQKITVSSTEIE